MNEEPFEEDLKRVPWPILTSQMPIVTDILWSLTHRQDCIVFTRHLPGSMLQKLYFSEFATEWMNLKPAKELDIVSELFLENPLIEEKRRLLMRDAYLYHVEFVQTGKIAEVLAKMQPDGKYHRQLSALKRLHEGDIVSALELLQEQLKLDGCKLFEAAHRTCRSWTSQESRDTDEEPRGENYGKLLRTPARAASLPDR